MNKGKAKIQGRVKEIKQKKFKSVGKVFFSVPIAPSKGKCSCDVCKAIRKVAK